jgi:hypothetical protein
MSSIASQGVDIAEVPLAFIRATPLSFCSRITEGRLKRVYFAVS